MQATRRGWRQPLSNTLSLSYYLHSPQSQFLMVNYCKKPIPWNAQVSASAIDDAKGIIQYFVYRGIAISDAIDWIKRVSPCVIAISLRTSAVEELAVLCPSRHWVLAFEPDEGLKRINNTWLCKPVEVHWEDADREAEAARKKLDEEGYA